MVSAAVSPGVPAPRFRVLCNAESYHLQIPEHRRATWVELVRRGSVELVPTEAGLHVGGEIRATQVANLDALVVVGGGKGANHLAALARRAGKPVIPIDTAIGSANGDGDGSVAHYRAALRDAGSYVRLVHGDAGRVIARLSLRDRVAEPTQLSKDVGDLLVGAVHVTGPIDAVLLTVVPVELAAARLLLRRDLAEAEERTPQGTAFRRMGGTAVACVGIAGNASVGPVATDLIKSLGARVIVLAGIAGGDPDSTKIGDVVIADPVIGYEGAALVGDEEPARRARPVVRSLDHQGRQFLASHLADSPAVRLAARWGGEPVAIDVAAVASGEKLVRSEAYFAELKSQHDKLRAIEMEALGFVEACLIAQVPHFVVRGISDHANMAKADEPQARAARNAVAVAVDLLEAWLRRHPA